MTKTKLTRRLQVVADLVDKPNITDVGCDHGKLDAYLFENKLIKYSLVSDISDACLSKAVTLLNQMHVNFDHAVCDGIYQYANADLAVICGMGGAEIIKILRNNKSGIKRFILGPQHDEVNLKKYLVKHNYNITDDLFICDNGKFYNIIKCYQDVCKHPITKEQLYFGNRDIRSDYWDYIENRYDKVSGIISYMPLLKSLEMRRYLKLIKRVRNREKSL